MVVDNATPGTTVVAAAVGVTVKLSLFVLNSGKSLLPLGMSRAAGEFSGFSINWGLVVGSTLAVYALKCLVVLGLDAFFFLALLTTTNTRFWMHFLVS